MLVTIKSGNYIAKIDTFGAELKSFVNDKTKKEYIWYGDKKYWKRSSPILFPFVGASKDNKYVYDDKEYSIMQHGFARDKEFRLIKQSLDEVWFSLLSDEYTNEIYPFNFELKIGYKLIENRLSVCWKVYNYSSDIMYFSIGAHPAFLCSEEKKGYKLCFDCDGYLNYRGLDKDTGLALEENNKFLLVDRKLIITENFFDRSALIFEDGKVHCVGIEDNRGKRLVDVCFDAPLFGLWSPEGKNAPFICIEPWYGRCDSVLFNGDLSEKAYINSINNNEVFTKEYNIIFY